MTGSWDMYPDSAVEYLLREGPPPCPPDCERDHVPCTRKRWTETETGEGESTP